MSLKLEDFDAYKKAMAFWRSVSALLERPAFRKERKLHEQILEANDSIVANLAEGFEQSTDRAFANVVYHSKGSTAEVLSRLRQAEFRKCITAAELELHLKLGDEVRRLLAGLARYLAKSDYKERGRFKNNSENATQDRGLRTNDQGPTTKD